MRRHWLLVGFSALSILGVRGWMAKPAKAATITHVAEIMGGDLRSNMSEAQSRYLRCQPHHWKQVVIKN
jgi:hypothetical protein